jgi:hypothetical protein
MAEMGLFVGWGAPVRGREAKGLEVFNEAVAYAGRLQEEGRIESSEIVLLTPHGGDLYGFQLLRGTRENIDAIRAEEEFQRITFRAGLIVERFGVVPAVLGEGLGEAINLYQQQVAELAS